MELIEKWWPIGLLVFSNVFYQISAKSIPSSLNPYAALIITYATATLVSVAMFLATTKGNMGLFKLCDINWAPVILGLAIVGVEVGSVFMYKAGWTINSGFLVQSIFLSVVLVFVGLLLYKEAITLPKFMGIVFCLIGVYFIKK